MNDDAFREETVGASFQQSIREVPFGAVYRINSRLHRVFPL